MATEGLSSICAGLGSIEEDSSGKRIGYTKGTHCLDNLKDLVRFLRRDDPQTRDVFKLLSKWNIVANDLIPIIEHCQDERDLVLNSVKVLVFLSMPIDSASTDINGQLEYLWKLKTVITHSDAVAVIVSLLEVPLENLERDALTEDDRKLVQLVMTLFRNILAVQEIPAHQNAEGSAVHLLSLRDSFLSLLFRENFMDVVVVLTQHIGGYGCHLRQDNVLFLDIFHNIFKGQNSEYIAKVSQDSKGDGDAKECIESLRSLMKEEEEKKKVKRLNSLARHSQFSGTFARFTMDGSKTLHKRTPAGLNNVLAKPQVHRGVSKRVVWDQKSPPVINNDLLVSLHSFLNQFLSGAYNVLMHSIREDVEKEHHGIQHSDVRAFFQLAQFVTSFQYFKCIITKQHGEAGTTETPSGCDNSRAICGPIAETMNQNMFELVMSKWRYAFECLKETNDYKFLSTSGSLMKVMIRVLDLVLKHEPVDSKEHRTASILLYKLFYDQTDQGLTQYLFNLMKSFDAHKQPRSDLADLVEMIHVILRLMENLQTFGKLRVARKARRRRTKNEKGSVKNVNETQANHPIIQNQSIENTSTAGQELVGVSDLQTGTDKSSSNTDAAQNIAASEFEKQDAAENMMHGQKGDSKDFADNLMDGASEIEKQDVAESMMHGHKGDSEALADNLMDGASELGKQNVAENMMHGQEGDSEVLVDNLMDGASEFEKQDVDESMMHGQKEDSEAFADNLMDGASEFEKQDVPENMMHGQKGDSEALADNLMDGASNDGSSGDEQAVETDEVDFKLTTLLTSLMGNTTIKNICWLLKFYKSNSVSTNHYIICMLKRICEDLNLSPMLYELSYICTFYEILDENKSNPHKDYKNVVDFLTTFVRRLLRKMESQPLLFVELLFSKTRRDCHLINAQFMKNELGDMKNDLKKWNDNNDEGEASIRSGKKSAPKTVADALGDDEFDVAMPFEPSDHEEDNLDENMQEIVPDATKEYVNESVERSRRLNVNFDDGNGEDDIAEPSQKDASKTGSKPRRRTVFSDEMVEDLRRLHEKYKDQKKCAHLIANELSSEGTFTAAQVSRKLKQLGLHTGKQVKGSMPMTDEDPDNLPLASIRKRRNAAEVNATSPNRDLLAEIDSAAISSDDEILSSIIKKSKTKSKRKQKLSTLNQPPLSGTGSDHDHPQGSPEREKLSDSVIDSHEGENKEGIPPGDDELFDYQDSDVELADESAQKASPGSSVKRRKLRMVIDMEDDEE